VISIIICTADLKGIKKIENNIIQTIGIEHELLFIDNTQSQYSIFQAYNIGINKSIFPILCFMHDDILYHTKDWGKIVVNHFSENKIGMIGTVGTSYLSDIPSTWWGGGVKLIGSGQDIIYQNNIDTDRNTHDNKNAPIINPRNELISEVVVLDGLWFCIRKELFSKISFDEKLYNGFHFYDLDISLQVVHTGYKICVIYDLIIEHISDSKYDTPWILSCIKFYHKWRRHLPASIHPVKNKTIKMIEYESARVLVNLLKSSNAFRLLFNFPLPMYLKIFYLLITNRLRKIM
jgi:hypothetical protein